MPAKLDKIDLLLKRAIATRFKEIRLATGRTQEDLAHEAGRDKQSYSKNERGLGASIYTINKFCIENGLSLQQFFDSDHFHVTESEEKIDKS